MTTPRCRNIKMVYVCHIASSFLEEHMLANLLSKRKFSHLVYETKIHTANIKIIIPTSQEGF